MKYTRDMIRDLVNDSELIALINDDLQNYIDCGYEYMGELDSVDDLSDYQKVAYVITNYSSIESYKHEMTPIQL